MTSSEENDCIPLSRSSSCLTPEYEVMSTSTNTYTICLDLGAINNCTTISDIRECANFSSGFRLERRCNQNNFPGCSHHVCPTLIYNSSIIMSGIILN